MGLLFLFLFSIFTLGKHIIVFLRHLFANPPKPLGMERKDILELTLALAYFFTYIIH